MIVINKKEECAGCSACYDICKHNAIKMRPDEQGFLYPTIDSTICINCGLCNAVCPITNCDKRNKDYKNIFAVRLKDEETLIKSSSGGLFYAFASYVITQKHGVVFGVEYDNMEVKHSFTETLEGLDAFHGSKYVQSNTLKIYSKVKDFLIQGRFVMFTGTPCQVMALRLYLRREYTNLLTMDLICHSVPSPLIFKEYIDYVEKKHNRKLSSIDMRNKRYGWSHRFYYYYKFKDGTAVGSEKLHAEHWGKLFFSGLITRPSCNDCKFTNFRRAGDITGADFWDDLQKRPEVYSSKGTSLLIINTDAGYSIFESVKSTFHSWELKKDEAMQNCLISPYAANPQKDEFWNYYENYGFTKAYNRYFKTSLLSKCKHKVKTVLACMNLLPSVNSCRN